MGFGKQPLSLTSGLPTHICTLLHAEGALYEHTVGGILKHTVGHTLKALSTATSEVSIRNLGW